MEIICKQESWQDAIEQMRFGALQVRGALARISAARQLLEAVPVGALRRAAKQGNGE